MKGPDMPKASAATTAMERPVMVDERRMDGLYDEGFSPGVDC